MKISTKLTEANSAKVLALLAETPKYLQELSADLTEQQHYAPLAPGEWSLNQVVAHLIACADVRGDRIYFALLLDDAAVPDVHPQRQWERLLRYADQPIGDLLADFTLRRRVLLSVLTPLSESEWAREIAGDKRKQSVYLLARNIARHEFDHRQNIEEKLPAFFGVM